MCQDAPCTPLRKPYVGPYKVLQPGNKTLNLDMGGKEEIISMVRLKPANLHIDSPMQVSIPIQHQPAKAHATASTHSPGTISPTAGAPESISSPTRTWAHITAPIICVLGPAITI